MDNRVLFVLLCCLFLIMSSIAKTEEPTIPKPNIICTNLINIANWAKRNVSVGDILLDSDGIPEADKKQLEVVNSHFEDIFELARRKYFLFRCNKDE